MPSFNSLSYESPEDLQFRFALVPVFCGFNLNIGADQVFPEINFTFPLMDVGPDGHKAISAKFVGIVDSVTDRIVDIINLDEYHIDF